MAVSFLAGCLGIGLGGCGVFNSSFIALLDPSGASTTIPNASGHIVVQFVNNASVQERLITFLETNGGLQLTDGEKLALKPRVRFRVLVTFRNGNTTTFEIVDGSSNLIDQRFSAETFPDLNQNDLNNAVVACGAGVARVEVLPRSPIEVFIPVEWLEFAQREITNPATGFVTFEFVRGQRFPPQFRALLPDDVDADNNVLARRNVGIRDLPGPAVNPVCGTVVVIVMDGVLSMPFLPEGGGLASFDVGDRSTAGGIGGRFEFRTLMLDR